VGLFGAACSTRYCNLPRARHVCGRIRSEGRPSDLSLCLLEEWDTQFISVIHHRPNRRLLRSRPSKLTLEELMTDRPIAAAGLPRHKGVAEWLRQNLFAGQCTQGTIEA
jgi:hypothetical protein